MRRRKQWMAALVYGLFSAPWTAQAGEETVRYIHTDALGSVVAISDEAGNIVERREYEPFGVQLTPVLADGPGYTGHVQDAVTGLTYMQQRYYDPEIGRFLSVDPVTAYSDPVGAFNRYWYANNNPYRFTDPDGRQVSEPRSCHTTNSCVSLEQANQQIGRDGRLLMGTLLGSAATGGTAAVAVAAGAPQAVVSVGRAVMVAGEEASLATGMAAQQGLNATSATAYAAGTMIAGSVEADIARGIYASGVANMDKIADAVSSYVVPGPPAMTPAGAAAGLTSAVVGEATKPESKPPEPVRDPKR